MEKKINNNLNPIIDSINELTSLSKIKPSLGCVFCKSKSYTKLNFVLSLKEKKIFINVNCECLNMTEIINIDELYSGKSTNLDKTSKIPTNELLNKVKEIFLKNNEFIQKFLKIINNSKYPQKYKKLFIERVISSYNMNLKINIECYKLLHLLNTNYRYITLNNLFEENQCKLNKNFGIDEIKYPIEDTVNIIESYYKNNFLINIRVGDNKSKSNPKNIKKAQNDSTQESFILFDGRLLTWKDKGQNELYLYTKKDGELIKQFTLEDLKQRYNRPREKNKLIKVLQFSNGNVCFITMNRILVYDESIDKIVERIVYYQQFCDYCRCVFFNFTNGKIFKYLHELGGFEVCEVDPKTKRLKLLEYFSKSSCDGIREIQDDKSLINSRDIRVIIFNQKTLQIETYIQSDSLLYNCFLKYYFNESDVQNKKIIFVTLEELDDEEEKTQINSNEKSEQNIPIEFRLFLMETHNSEKNRIIINCLTEKRKKINNYY